MPQRTPQSSFRLFSDRSRLVGMIQRFLVCSICIGSFASPARANTAIAAAFEAGVLDYETALLYGVYAVRDPESLPEAFRPTVADLHPSCGTPALVAAQQAAPHLSAAFRAKLARTLQRPSRANTLETASGRFRLHYDVDGRHGVDLADDDGNGIPDYIDVTAATLDDVWELQVVELGYRAPLEDGNVGGGNQYDVYLTELSGSGVYGYAFPELSGNTTPVYFEIDNNFTDPIYVQTRGLDALHVTLAHEFFHGVQFSYYSGRNGLWWQEASATWMEEVAYPEVDDYLQYIPSVLRRPERALSSGNFTVETRIYGSAIFAHFLDQRFGRGLIRAIWEEMGTSNHARLVNFERAIRQWIPGGLAEAIGEYAVWNYFTGANHRAGMFYAEGEKYGEVRTHTLQTVSKVAVVDSGQVDHTGSAYLKLEPQLQSGGVALDLETEEGTWKRRLLLISRDAVEILDAETDQVQVKDWDRFDEIVVVLSSLEQSGAGFEYTVAAEYDSNLLSGGTDSLVFRLEQNRPNPFRILGLEKTVIPYALDEASDDTRISIFSATGELVRVLKQGQRSARSFAATWDGTNQQGEAVGSGIYFYVLEANGRTAKRTLAVVRD
jgi:hypothetical protein